MITRSRHLSIARIALALMLFAQAAMAWSACGWLTRAPERAVRAAVEQLGCHDMRAEPSVSPTTCLAHCLSEKQSLYKPALDVPATPGASVLTVVLPIDTVSATSIAHRSDPAAGAGPPRRILLQSFQI